jgi:acylphosphatase
MKALHLIISGQVQGVGFRAWLAGEARSRDVSGWVRNRRGGEVEALLFGPSDRVDAIVAACHHGPSAAVVTSVAAAPAEPPSNRAFTVRASI